MSKVIDQAKDIFDLEIKGLNKIKNLIDDSFEKLVTECAKVLDNGGKIVLSGIGKSGHIGYKIAATLASTGSHATFMHPVEAMHGDLGILQNKDLLLTLSYSGETEELLTILPSAKRLNVPIASITGNSKSKLAKWSDIVIAIPIEKEACPFNLAPTTSTTAQLVLGDALAMVLLETRGFTKEDYGRIHPGGAIGRSVTLKITDIMRNENTDRLVKIPPYATVKDTILKMTKAKSGSAIVVDKNDKLLGVFTDGDLRRHLKDLTMLDESVDKYMTVGPVTVFSDQMAVNVLKLIEERRVDDIVVIDRDNKVVGIVDSQDLPGLKLM
ncbi:MAG TPA: KpsF/GutQ family sugar-phosphate isomerase [Victivallales bacterium]|nr:KpsF/GutQ family sugar-phosphate isomerase [Victivallales bacterium]